MAKSSGTGPGILIIMGFILIFIGLMWDAGIGMAWNDLNNSTQANTTQHAATSAGQIFSSGFGIIISIIGVLLLVGAVIMIIMSATKIGGR
jgi:phage-related minor tail protein